MRYSKFRVWVDAIWRENCQERRIWCENEDSLPEYFNRYKWWLKREFRFQQNK